MVMNRISTAGFEISTECYLLPTPAGAYYAVQANGSDPARHFLLYLLSQMETPLLGAEQLQVIDSDNDTALRVLYHMQNMGYVQALTVPVQNLKGQLEEILPPLLAQVADSGKAILADEQGFYLSLCGFSHETAEELSALSANLYAVHDRHRKLLQNNMGIKSSAWGIIDAAGNSGIGFWPLYFPRNRFSLILSGLPQFNSEAFTTLIACLAMRYNT
jgi:hypothetical protein